jgi:hypothetical protein
MMRTGAINRMIVWCLVLLLAGRISRREDAVVYRAGLPNQTGSLALRFRDKSNNFAHIGSEHWLEKHSALEQQAHHTMTLIISSGCRICLDLEARQAVTTHNKLAVAFHELCVFPTNEA